MKLEIGRDLAPADLAAVLARFGSLRILYLDYNAGLGRGGIAEALREAGAPCLP